MGPYWEFSEQNVVAVSLFKWSVLVQSVFFCTIYRSVSFYQRKKAVGKTEKQNIGQQEDYKEEYSTARTQKIG